jgi:hypothetical protein
MASDEKDRAAASGDRETRGPGKFVAVAVREGCIAFENALDRDETAPLADAGAAPRKQEAKAPPAPAERTVPAAPLGASVRPSSRPPPPLQRRGDRALPPNLVADPPPPVAPPEGLVSFHGEPQAPAQRCFGSASHAGPPEVAQDKGNQDFAFHLELPGPDGAPWVLCGVADGAGEGTWSSRASQQAAAGFIEGVRDFFASADCPRDEAGLRGDRWSVPLAERIHGRLRARLSADADLLRRGGFVDPTWDPHEYARCFLDAPDAEATIRAKWLQTTLLAAALGPYGGFALFIGDGFARVDRQFEGGRWESSPGLSPTPPVTMEISDAQVRACLTRLLPRGARGLGVLLTTDGVSNSTEAALERAIEGAAILEGYGAKPPPLERVRLASSQECMRVLERLARMPQGLADRDNMSIAFGHRELATPEAR